MGEGWLAWPMSACPPSNKQDTGTGTPLAAPVPGPVCYMSLVFVVGAKGHARCIEFRWVLKASLGARVCPSHYRDEETEIQVSEVTSPRPRELQPPSPVPGEGPL